MNIMRKKPSLQSWPLIGKRLFARLELLPLERCLNYGMCVVDSVKASYQSTLVLPKVPTALAFTHSCQLLQIDSRIIPAKNTRNHEIL